MRTLSAYQEAIRTRVCVHCIQRTGRGICGTGEWGDCALNRYMPQIVEIVNSVNSNSLHDYIHELRNVICVSCKDDVDGLCKLRETLECALDRYFPLVIEAVEEVNARA